MQELKELEKLASLHEIAGDPHKHILDEEEFLLDEEIRLQNLKEEGRKARRKFITDKKEAFNRQVQAEMTLDPDSLDQPKVVSDAEYLSIYQVPMTNSLRIDLKLP